MFYVSKKTPSGWYIYDDTDGSEELVTFKDIKQLIKMGVQVDGISHNGLRDIRISVVNTEVSPMAAKQLFLNGINVRVNDRVLEHLSLVDKTKGRTIVLGDLCTELEQYSVVECKNCTFVFDDRIEEIHNKAFINVQGNNNKFDITNLTSNKLAYKVYRYFIYCAFSEDDAMTRKDFNRTIIDKPDRFLKYATEVCLIKYAVNYSESMDSALEAYILKKYKKSFLSALPKEENVRLDSTAGSWRRHFNEYAVRLREVLSYIDSCGSSVIQDALSKVDKHSVFSSRLTSTNKALKSVGAYIRNGGKDEDIVEGFIDYLRTVEYVYRNA